MKHIVIGDIHGRDNWQEINIKNYDKIIFIGDYVDSHTLSDFAILENFKKIVSLKKRHPQKVVLLLGNHDVQYLHYPAQRCTGFRDSMQRGLTYLFNKDRDLFQMAYQHNKYIFTHAGITNAWYDEFLRLPAFEGLKDETNTIADLINKVETTTQRYLLYATSIYRGGYSNGSFLWADYKETSIDMLNNYHQIVGHTQVQDIHTISYTKKSVTYIDVLHSQTKFCELDI
nr:metallophosphoesterase [Mucilaginibacter sp. L294]